MKNVTIEDIERVEESLGITSADTVRFSSIGEMVAEVKSKIAEGKTFKKFDNPARLQMGFECNEDSTRFVVKITAIRGDKEFGKKLINDRMGLLK